MRSANRKFFTFLMLFGMFFLQVAQIAEPSNYFKIIAIISAEEDLNETADQDKDAKDSLDDLNQEFLSQEVPAFLLSFVTVQHFPFKDPNFSTHTRSHIKPPPKV